MYAEHFNLRAEPFGLTPDPAFLYLSPEHREAMAAVQYGLLDGRGFITLMGEVGTGKTTLLYSLLGQLGPEVQVAYVAYTTQDFPSLLVAALKDLGVEAAGASKHELLSRFNALLLEAADAGRTVAIVIDEAQNLTDEAFEELRLLSNFETYERKLLQIVLVGQPELQARLHQPRLRQLRERVSVRTFINPLSAIEMRRYIEHRVQRVGGAARDLFTVPALGLIVRRTQGIPRRANILCHNALLFAYGRNLARVTAAVAREAIAEMDERRPGLLRRAGLRRVRPPSWVARWAAVLALVFLLVLLVDRLLSPALSGARVPPPVRSSVGLPASRAPAPAPSREPIAALELPALRFEEPARPLPLEEPAPPSPAPAERAAVQPPAAPPALRPASAPARAAAAPDGPAFLTIAMPRGKTLMGLVRDLYGDEANLGELLAAIRRLNPAIRDVDRLAAGVRLRLPWPPVPGEGP
jgi:general secretion pathway protein A